MTQKKMAVVIGTWVSFSIAQGCGPPSATRDPLLGAWTRAEPNYIQSYVCQFFENGEWANSCYLTSGYAQKWERLDQNRYYLGNTNGACDAKTTFSADEKAVTISMLCGTTEMQIVQLARFK